VSNTEPRIRSKRSSIPAGPSWSVYTTFRKARLALGRGFPTWEAARDFALRVRKERFHDRDAVHVVDDATREVCPLPPEQDAPALPPSAGGDSGLASGAGVRGYSVFASFHRGRIPLARDLASLDDAVAVVERFRSNRFDRSQSLVIVDETTGEAMTPEEVGASPTTPSRERLLEVQALAEDVAAALAASAEHERWLPWMQRADTVRAAAQALLDCAGSAASRRRTRPASGVRRRLAGAA